MTGIPATPEAVFTLRLRPQKVAFALGGVSATVPQSTVEWLFAELEKNKPYQPFLRGLRVRLPLSLGGNLVLKGRTERKEVSTNGGGTRISLEVTRPEMRTSIPLFVRPPIITRSGIWFFGSTAEQQHTLNKAQESLGGGDIWRKRQELIVSATTKISELPRQKEDVVVWINRNLLGQTVTGLALLPPKSRTVKFRSLSYNGNLVESNNKVLGQRGGYSVSLANPSAVNGFIELRPPEARWVESHGHTIRLPFHAELNAKVRLRIDAYVGGDIVNDTFSIKGTTDGAIQASLVAQVLTAGAHKAFVVGPVIHCDEVKYELEAGGELKWGARMALSVGATQPAPSVLLSSVPEYLPITSTATNDERLRYTDRWMEVVLTPLTVNITNRGLKFGGAFSAKGSSSLPSEIASTQLQSSLAASIAEQWSLIHGASCGQKSTFVFLFAGQDFGPNNELVKLFDEMWKLGNRSLDNIKITGERMKRVIENPDQINEVAQETFDAARAERRRLNAKIEKIPVVGKVYGKVKKIGKKLGF